MVTSLLIFLLYMISTGLAAWLLWRRFDGLMLVMFVFALGLGFEEYEWFLPQIFSGTDEWPARNFSQAFAVALRGIPTPTTIPELAVVTFGRLFILFTVLYGGFFLVKYWPAVVAYIRSMPPSILALLLLWEGCLLINFTLVALQIDLGFDGAGLCRLLGAVACLFYMINTVLLNRASPPPSSAAA